MPAITNRTVGNWVIEQPIGSGSFAVVWKARHAVTGAPAAVKEISTDKLNKKLQESLHSEIAVLERTKHTNIVCLLDLYKEPGKIYLVLEYCGGGDLGHYLRRYGACGEAAARHLLQQLVEGLKVLRSHNVIHRDLKPQNLLLSDTGPLPPLKIADFGFARPLQPQGLAETLCGSPLYMAPEILQLQKYDAKADLWSVGAILFELLVGKPPFNGANHLQLVQNIERGQAVIPEHVAQHLSPACMGLVHQLLRRNPIERISFEELFAHPFLLGQPGQQLQPMAPGSGPGAAPGAASQQLHVQPVSWQPAAHGAAPLHHLAPPPASTGAVRVVKVSRAVSAGTATAPAVAPGASTGRAPTQQAQQPATAPAPLSSPNQQQQQHALSPAGADAMPPAAGGIQLQPQALLPIHVRELTRSPSPRLTAVAAAVATALEGSSPALLGTHPGGMPPAEPIAAAAAGQHLQPLAGQAAAAEEGMTQVPLGEPRDAATTSMAESIDSDYDYVVISNPGSPRVRTPLPPVATPGSAAQKLQQQAAQQRGGAAPPLPATGQLATTTGAAAGAAAAAPGYAPSLQPTLPAGPRPAYGHAASIAAATPPPAGGARAPSQPPGFAPGAALQPPTTLVVRLPEQLDTADLLQRVVQLLLDTAAARSDTLLDQEAEDRALAGGSVALHYGGSMAMPGGFGAGAGGGGLGADPGMGSEAAAVVGLLLVACRLLNAAFGGSSRQQDHDQQQQQYKHHFQECGAGGDGGLQQGLVGGEAHAHGAGMAAAAASRAAHRLPQHSLLAAHARSLLAAIDDRLHGGVAQLLRGCEPVACTLDVLLGAALRYSRAAAGEELLGNVRGAVEAYARAADLLLFLLMPDAGPAAPAVRPALPPCEQQRVYKYYAAVRLRQSTCMSALNAAAAGLVGIGGVGGAIAAAQLQGGMAALGLAR